MTGTNTRDHFDRWFHNQIAAGDNPPIHAATVIVLRDQIRAGSPAGDVEVLMFRKNTKITFGGAWVFPGGRLDPADYGHGRDDHYDASATAAVREAHEEGSIVLNTDDLVRYSHWMPPRTAPKRFSTWFFLAGAPVGAVTIDDGEITDHDWVRPAEMLRRHGAGEVDLAPPTWVTLADLSRHNSVADALGDARHATPEFFVTRTSRTDDGVVALWTGDAGYETSDASTPGDRHRLLMCQGHWLYERTVTQHRR